VRQEISEWSVSDPISGGTECPRKFARTGSVENKENRD